MVATDTFLFGKCITPINSIKWGFIFGLLLLSMCRVWAQCGITVDAGSDQLECSIPSAFQLDGLVTSTESTDIILSTFWTPSLGLSDPFALNTTAAVSVSTTYTLNTTSFNMSNNLALNGDFESGSSGFTTDYTNNANPRIQGNQLVEGQYSIGVNPAPMHNNWVDCGDHTTGVGNMMIVNGHESPDQNVWCQTIDVMPNTDYAFSAWVTSVDPIGPGEIQFNIDGSPLNAGNIVLSNTCAWQNFFEIWNSSLSTFITICIKDLNTDEAGNDFAIDDIVFAPICETSDEVTLSPSAVAASIVNNGPVFCESETLQLEAIGGSTYKWSGPNNFSHDGESFMISNLGPEHSGIYEVVATNRDGCVDTLSTMVTIYPSYLIEVQVSTCDMNQVGIFTEVLNNQNGCDSTIITTVSLDSSSILEVTETTCDSSEVGIFTEMLTNQFGCDSIINTIVILEPSNLVELTQMTCLSSEVGTFTQMLTNQFGCDSIVNTTILLDPNSMVEVIETTCDSSVVGVFTQVLTNQFGCDSIIINTTVLSTIESIATVSSNYNGTDISCNGSADGSANVSIVGGQSPYQYEWSNGGNESDLFQLEAGEYAVTVTDANGCVDMASVVLQEPERMEIDLVVNDPNCFSQNNGEVFVEPIGGTMPYLYSLNDSDFQADGDFIDLADGVYEISIVDANDCLTEEIFTINNSIPLSIELGEDLIIQSGNSEEINAVVNVPLDSLRSVLWLSSDNLECQNCLTQTVSPIITTSYSVIVTDNNGCSADDALDVIVEQGKDIYAPNVFSPNANSNNNIFTLFARERTVEEIQYFRIFDRWGHKIYQQLNFRPNDISYGWDGTFKGKELDSAVFVWIAEVLYFDGTKEILAADIALVK